MSRTVWIDDGGDWVRTLDDRPDLGANEDEGDLLVVNMGPQHPSTHGPMRFTLELAGETVVSVRPTIGFLHTGIEKSMEYRTWTQAVTYCTRMDYVASLFNEAAYVRSVERLLGIEDGVPARALLLRILVLELNRIASHLVAVGSGGMEIGALTVMTVSLRERELCLDILESITGLRMNHGYIRPGGVAGDLPAGCLDELADFEALMARRLPEYAALCHANPVFRARLEGVGVLARDACLALGVSGPVLRATGLPWDLRRTQPYWGYDTFDFEVATAEGSDAYARLCIRLEEIEQSLRIVGQCRLRLADETGPVMVADRRIAWPAQLSVGGDGQGTSGDHVSQIMGQSMESLIHHFKLVTEGFRVPTGEAYAPIESPRGELGVHLVSDGGTRPYRAHVRDPSFANLQCLPLMSEGGQVADFIVALASIDPVCGGVDR